MCHVYTHVIHIYIYKCLCVCVCVRERERERERVFVGFWPMMRCLTPFLVSTSWHLRDEVKRLNPFYAGTPLGSRFE
jgi:hypothetical protein